MDPLVIGRPKVIETTPIVSAYQAEGQTNDPPPLISRLKKRILRLQPTDTCPKENHTSPHQTGEGPRNTQTCTNVSLPTTSYLPSQT